MTGSKLVFERATTPVSFWRLPSNGCGIYFHVAVLLNRRDGTGTDIIELCLDNEDECPTVKIRPAAEAYLRDPCPMKVDNTFMRELGLRRGNISLSKVFYRLSRLAGLDVSYNLTYRNCDHLATFLLNGEPLWTTMKWSSKLIKRLPLPNLYDGVVNHKLLAEIEMTLSVAGPGGRASASGRFGSSSRGGGKDKRKRPSGNKGQQSKKKRKN